MATGTGAAPLLLQVQLHPQLLFEANYGVVLSSRLLPQAYRLCQGGQLLGSSRLLLLLLRLLCLIQLRL